MNMREKKMLPLNLQFFADEEVAEPKETVEETVENKEEETVETKPEEKERNNPDLMIENAKMKRAIDKLTKELGDMTKKYRATLSEKEVMDEEKAEAAARKEEEFESMKRQLKINEYTENFMALGYSRDLAKQAASAQVDGDTESLFKIQSEVQSQLIKAKEAEWIASRPQLQSGGEPKEEDDPFIKGFNSVKQYH